MRHLISLKELGKKDLLEILDLAKDLKKKRKAGETIDYLKNKTMIMLFEKSSTRTRLSFEAAMTELGGHAIFLDFRTTQFSLTDFENEIKAVMRFGQILMFRALKAQDVTTAASFNKIPVIDGCSEKYHPCQALGDIFTMMEYAKGLKNIKKAAWLGVENNVSNTLKLACAKLNIPMLIISPEADENSIDKELNNIADKTGMIQYANLASTTPKMFKDVDFIHTDTWMNMEFFEKGVIRPQYEKEFERRKAVFSPYQLSAKFVDANCPNARIMHCMPCHIGYEITQNAVSHRNSIIFDQAENRLHIQKAIIMWLLSK